MHVNAIANSSRELQQASFHRRFCGWIISSSWAMWKSEAWNRLEPKNWSLTATPQPWSNLIPTHLGNIEQWIWIMMIMMFTIHYCLLFRWNLFTMNILLIVAMNNYSLWHLAMLDLCWGIPNFRMQRLQRLQRLWTSPCGPTAHGDSNPPSFGIRWHLMTGDDICGFVWKCWVNIPNEIAI